MQEAIGGELHRGVEVSGRESRRIQNNFKLNSATTKMLDNYVESTKLTENYGKESLSSSDASILALSEIDFAFTGNRPQTSKFRRATHHGISRNIMRSQLRIRGW